MYIYINDILQWLLIVFLFVCGTEWGVPVPLKRAYSIDVQIQGYVRLFAPVVIVFLLPDSSATGQVWMCTTATSSYGRCVYKLNQQQQKATATEYP